MDNEYLAKQLSRLRIRAGNPSLRDLERLTERQGRRMSRASIQDKFSGSSALKMVQVLALVQACADYARSIGAPLSAAEMDEQAWREKVGRAPTPRSQPNPRPNGDDSNSSTLAAPPEIKLLIEPLIHAGMDDIVRIATEKVNQPLETWLPTVLSALGEAQMDPQGFLNLAIREPASRTVQILNAIAEEEDGSGNVASLYFQTCLLAKHAAELPKLLVALRRHDGELSYWCANGFIDTILGRGEWPGSTRTDLTDILRALRAATLKDDADKLAEAIGTHSRPKLALTTAGSFPASFLGDRELILYAASQSGNNRLLDIIACLREEAIPGIDPHEALDFILPSVPKEDRTRLSHALSDAGMHPEAEMLMKLTDQAPS
ncbi:hypothetical protein [Streptomyces sp. HUAS TT7]|uniref:hypothetical protein n=1 Tax=Streptomyces sp. HUAS TT7 TaxID=3447507 RepID=UPI003F65545E